MEKGFKETVRRGEKSDVETVAQYRLEAEAWIDGLEPGQNGGTINWTELAAGENGEENFKLAVRIALSRLPSYQAYLKAYEAISGESEQEAARLAMADLDTYADMAWQPFKSHLAEQAQAA